MHILLYTDNHFSQYSSIVRSRGEKFSTRLENQIKSINWAEQLAVDEKCEKIIHLGDFFDKSELNAEELTALQEIKWADMEHVFLVGNHEMGINDLSYSSAHLFNMVPKAKVIDKVSCDGGFGYELIYLPYTLETNRKPLSEYFKELYQDVWSTQEVKNRIIFSHNDICGIRYGQYESKVGFDIHDIENHCDLFINGHLHNQTQVTKKILNLGNLTGQNFSEDAVKYNHCAAILDTETLKVDLIVNPFAFNFYQLEVLNRAEFNKLDVCRDQSVLSVKTYQSLVNDLKTSLIGMSNIIAYRITTIPEPTKDTKIDNIKDLLKLNHIEQFKQFIQQNLDNSEILNEELSYIN